MEELTEAINLSQKRRLFLHRALQIGERAAWDYPAPDQPADQCLRGSKKYNDWAYGDVLK